MNAIETLQKRIKRRQQALRVLSSPILIRDFLVSDVVDESEAGAYGAILDQKIGRLEYSELDGMHYLRRIILDVRPRHGGKNWSVKVFKKYEGKVEHDSFLLRLFEYKAFKLLKLPKHFAMVIIAIWLGEY